MRVGHAYKLHNYGEAPLKVSAVVPDPKGEEVLLKVAYAGACHSDVHIMDGYQDLGDGERIDFSETNMPIPLTMGHEIVGEVVAVGDAVDKNLIGQQRLIYPWIGCGHCISCYSGQDNHCETPQTLGIFSDGGYADYVLVPAQKYMLDITGIDPAWACTLACSGVTVYSALQQLQPQKRNSSIAIIGLGGLGLMAISVANALGIDNIIACDISEDRLEVARALGARNVLNTKNANATDQLIELSQGQLFGVIDTVGLPATVNMGIAATMKGGRLILVGLQGGKIALPLPTLPFKALSLIGSYTGTLSELKELVSLVKTGALQTTPVKIKPMSCLHKTLEELRSGQVLGRVVLQPDPIKG